MNRKDSPDDEDSVLSSICSISMHSEVFGSSGWTRGVPLYTASYNTGIYLHLKDVHAWEPYTDAPVLSQLFPNTEAQNDNS